MLWVGGQCRERTALNSGKLWKKSRGTPNACNDGWDPRRTGRCVPLQRVDMFPHWPLFGTTVNTDILTPKEKAQLLALEERVDRGLRELCALGAALQEILDRRLYRESGTFSNYLKVRFNLCVSVGFELMKAAKTLGILDAAGITDVPQQVSMLRPFAKIPEADLPDVYREVQRRIAPEKRTGRLIAQTVNEIGAERYGGAPVKQSLPRMLGPFSPDEMQLILNATGERDPERWVVACARAVLKMRAAA